MKSKAQEVSTSVGIPLSVYAREDFVVQREGIPCATAMASGCLYILYPLHSVPYPAKLKFANSLTFDYGKITAITV